MARDNGTPNETDDTITLTKSDLSELLTSAMANAAKIAAEASQATRDHRREDVDFLAGISSRPAEEREPALLAYLASLSPQQRESRETAIRDAYAGMAKVAEPQTGMVPGSSVSVGRDSQGAPVLAKVRTTRQYLESVYPMVDVFVATAPRGGVTIKGANFPLHRGINRVPSIVAEQYAWWAETSDRIERSYPPLMATEQDAMNQLLARGARQVISRVHQVGVGVLPEDVFQAQPVRTE